MAELKINEALCSDIGNLKSSANSINNGYESIPSDDMNSLKTAVCYISQQDKIKALLELYKDLILRDVKDLEDLVKEVKEMDKTISASNNR